MGISLKEIKKVDWEYAINRRESLLFRSFATGAYQYFKEVSGINWRINFYLHLHSGELYYCKKDLAKLRAIFSGQGIKSFIAFYNHLLFYIRALDKLVGEIERTDCTKLTKLQLINLTEEYFEAALRAYCFLSPLPIADKIISKMIVDLLPEAPEPERQKWLGILTYPDKENEHTREEREFYKLVPAYKKKNKKFKQLLAVHLKKFSWIGTRGYWWDKTWTEKDIQERINDFLAERKNPDKELKYLDGIRKERVLAARKLLAKFNIKKFSPLYKLISLAKELVYVRTWRADVIYQAGHQARGLFNEIASRAGANLSDLAYLTFKEVVETAKKNKLIITEEELAKRKEYFTIVLLKNDHFILSGKEWQRDFKNFTKQFQDKNKKIKGNIVFPGRVKGRVKLVLTGDDIKKVKRGDILVAVMTFSNFIPAMEKAVGFVTDEGGILCHAAIVSREMRKPCLIGTKVATKLLKDNDLVELDANQGVVNILKKK